jgi:protein-export membrane protein SecD
MRIWRAAAIVILAGASMVAADGAWAQAPTVDMDKPGAHLVLALERAEVRASWLGSMREEARTLLREARIVISGLAVEGDAVSVRVRKREDADAAMKALAELAPAASSGTTDRLPGLARSDIALAKKGDGIISIVPTEEGLGWRLSAALSDSLDISVRRLAGMGVVADTVRWDPHRIYVHVPTLQDTASLKDLLTRPAQLAFHELHPAIDAAKARQGRMPVGFKIYPGRVGEFFLRETPVARGSDIAGARPSVAHTGEPMVDLQLNASGTQAFGRFTSYNVGRRLAVVLDGVVLSAPEIRNAVLSGRASVVGGLTSQDASQLAVQLIAGGLTSRLAVVEERVIPPQR